MPQSHIGQRAFTYGVSSDFYRASISSSHIKKVKDITLNAGRNATCLQFPCRPCIIRACCAREPLLFIRGGDLYLRLLADCSFWPWKRSVILKCKTRYRIFSLTPSCDISDIFHFTAYFILGNKISTSTSPTIGWNSKCSQKCVSPSYFRRHHLS